MRHVYLPVAGRAGLLVILLAALAGLLLAACGMPGQTPASSAAGGAQAGKPAAGRIVNIDATEFALSLPDEIEGGLVTFRLTNAGHEAHHAQVVRLNDGISLDQFFAALKQNEMAALALVTAEGGPAVIDHSGTSEVTLHLKDGQYVVLCLIPGADGLPHVAKGMFKPVRVTAPATDTPLPTTSTAITLHDFAVVLPDRLPTGRGTYRVTNDGTQLHELVIVRLAPGKTLADVSGFFAAPPAGPPPFSWAGGMQGLNPGGAGLVTLDLTAGAYAAICLVPDPASGKAHLHLGMIRAFTVN